MTQTIYRRQPMPIWALCIVAIFSGQSCIETFVKRNLPVDPPKNSNSHPIPGNTKPDSSATSGCGYSQPGSVQPIVTPNQHIAKASACSGQPSVSPRPMVPSRKEQLKDRLLRRLDNNTLPMALKDRAKRYIEAFDSWPESIRRFALSAPALYDQDILNWVYDQCFAQDYRDIIGNFQQAIANASSVPTPQNLLDTLHDNEVFDAAAKTNIAYYIQELHPLMLEEICRHYGFTNNMDILRWIDEQVKLEKKSIENKKRSIEAKVREVMQQTTPKYETCAICFDQDKLYALQCGHYFHQALHYRVGSE